MDWKPRAEELFESHKNEPDRYAKIANILCSEGILPDYQKARQLTRDYFRRRDKMQTEAAESEQETDEPEEHEKLPCIQNQEPTITIMPWNGNRIIKFGILGDTHLNNKFTQITYLHRVYERFSYEGITDVYHTGDIDDGERMRPGHQYECYTQGFDDHIAEIVKVYPSQPGITTHFITGNHDASFIKHVGANIGMQIAKLRPDMKYLGSDCAVVYLTPNCTLELRHPWDGTSYAISYKSQKICDAISGGEKPSIMAIGHYHKAEYIFYRNVHILQSGTLCAQTPFMKGKAIAAHMGAWIITIEVDKSGTIQRFVPEFLPYYTAILNDYATWR